MNATFTRVYVFVARRTDDGEEAQDVTLSNNQALRNIGRWRGVPFAPRGSCCDAANAIADRWQRSSKSVEIPSDVPMERPRGAGASDVAEWNGGPCSSSWLGPFLRRPATV